MGISKAFIDVEDFHSKSERGVKQEVHAHILLINFTRVFEAEANKQLSPPSSKRDDGDVFSAKEDSYWQDFCGEIKNFKLNFKNCLLVVGRSLEELIFTTAGVKIECLDKLLKSIVRVRQRIRPGRHPLRQSRKPVNKWKSSNGGKVAYA